METFTAALLESDSFKAFGLKHCDLTKKRAKHAQGRFDVANFFWAFVHFGRMFASLVRFRPNVVYMPLTASWSGFLRDGVLAAMAKVSGARVIGHAHGGWFDRILALKGWRGRIVRVVLRLFDSLLLLGTKWRDLVVAYGYSGKVRIVPPMYRSTLQTAASSFVRSYAEAEPTGLFVGHVGPGKGVLDMLYALRLLRDRGIETRLWIVGPPQFEGDWEKVTAARAELGLEDSVEMTGPLEGETLYAKFKSASYLLLPSYFEGLPIVLFEAGLFGLPVVTTAVGAIPDLIVHERNGLLVPPGDVRAIAGAIERLYGDGALRQRLGRQLMSDIRRFDPKVVCATIASVVQGTIAESDV